MPFFTFRINDEIHYRVKLDSLQCIDHTKAGARCKRKCVIGSPYCCTHLAYRHHLKIKTSLIPNAGKGLFAIEPGNADLDEVLFDKGDTICAYKGELINLATLNERYGQYTAPYTIQISANSFEDAAKTRGIGSLANTKPNHQNATISIYQGRASLKATKDIKNGQEIYLSYGRQYRLHEPQVQYETTTK
jgi:hypothetical protein